MGPKTVTLICANFPISGNKISPSVEHTEREPNGTCVTHSPDEKYK